MQTLSSKAGTRALSDVTVVVTVSVRETKCRETATSRGIRKGFMEEVALEELFLLEKLKHSEC